MTSPRRALVTGADGFVGANLVQRLLADGHAVTAVGRPGGSRWRLEGLRGQVERGDVDLLDRAEVATLVTATTPDWVFHLAAYGAYPWQTDAARILESNALATVTLVEACQAAQCGAFVHAGSSSEYGLKDHPPSEDEVLEPNSAYAVGKAAATNYCAQVARTGRLNAVTLRLYSVYGAYEEPRRLIPRIVVAGLEGRLPPLAAPDTARDFVNVDDVVRALIMAAEHPSHNPGAVYNIGSGRQTQLRELVSLARELFGVAAEPEWGSAPARSWDTSTWVADPSRAARELGWTASTDLAAGLQSTAAWLRASPDIWETYAAQP